MFGEQACGHGKHVFTRGAGPEDDGEQFSGGERTGAETLESLTRALVGGELGDADLVGRLERGVVSGWGWLMADHGR